MTYSPKSDDRFIKTIKERRFNPVGIRLDSGKVVEHDGQTCWQSPDDEKFQEKRKIKTGLGSGWRYSSFCKTQYASSADCGGVPNFIRCHLSVIHLLDRIGQLPTMKVEIDDEGKYGRSYYTDDPWAEERVYTWHDGKYDVKALVEEVGEWNEMIATTFGAMNDMLKASGSAVGLESPISTFPDFEHLEFPWCPMFVALLETSTIPKGAIRDRSCRRPWREFAASIRRRGRVAATSARANKNCTCTS